MSSSPGRSVLGAVLIAAVVSLAITALRLYGEVQKWAPEVFRTDPGSPNAWFGITFLVIPFGFWFGRRLAANGHRPAHVGKTMLFAIVGMAVVAGVMYVVINHLKDWTVRAYLMNGGAVAAGLFLFAAWRRAWLTLVAYGLLARIPVVAAQYFSIQNGWDTHFAKGPPESNPADALFLLTMAQSFFWPFGFTVLVGGLFAAIGAATVRR
ncbi:MAG: hypothetical protein JNK15_06245 [Planctomycetes bacterium]|nr:hypothetical protein [Planctomycetota bacterium]